MERVNFESIIKGVKTKKQIINRLIEAGYSPDDLSDEYGYLNIRIHFSDGYYRIYKPYGKPYRNGENVKVQRWEKTVCKYSGIPTFEPSGKCSLKGRNETWQ